MKRIIKKAFAFAVAFVIFVLPATAAVGDINADGKFNSSDARTILRYSAKLTKLSDTQLIKADLNYDGKVNSSDARTALRAAARIITLDNFYQYDMSAVYKNSQTGAVTELNTAWQDGKALIHLDSSNALVYDSGKGEVAMINYPSKKYTVMSLADFKKKYPQNWEYFSDDGKSLCWSENLPTPLYLEDQGFSAGSYGGFTVYYKQFPGGWQQYTFNEKSLPVKCEYFSDGSLISLEIKSFSDNPSVLFTQYLSFSRY